MLAIKALAQVCRACIEADEAAFKNMIDTLHTEASDVG
jgi:hypothetical protein